MTDNLSIKSLNENRHMDYKGTSHFTSCCELKALTHTTLPVILRTSCFTYRSLCMQHFAQGLICSKFAARLLCVLNINVKFDWLIYSPMQAIWFGRRRNLTPESSEKNSKLQVRMWQRVLRGTFKFIARYAAVARTEILVIALSCVPGFAKEPWFTC